MMTRTTLDVMLGRGDEVRVGSRWIQQGIIVTVVKVEREDDVGEVTYKFTDKESLRRVFGPDSVEQMFGRTDTEDLDVFLKEFRPA
jgi:molybdopterin-guanine dinucleotide biosynthesis protein